jgi:hypothetical protein
MGRGGTPVQFLSRDAFVLRNKREGWATPPPAAGPDALRAMGSWFPGSPHPYFGNKILVFIRLEEGLRCKIVKTMEFSAK